MKEVKSEIGRQIHPPKRTARITRSGSSRKVSFEGSGVRMTPAFKSFSPASQDRCPHHATVHADRKLNYEKKRVCKQIHMQEH